jgi:hypothetical protein
MQSHFFIIGVLIMAATIIILAAVAAAVFFAVRSVVRDRKNGKMSCGCTGGDKGTCTGGCSGCGFRDCCSRPSDKGKVK